MKTLQSVTKCVHFIIDVHKRAFEKIGCSLLRIEEMGSCKNENVLEKLRVLIICNVTMF